MLRTLAMLSAIAAAGLISSPSAAAFLAAALAAAAAAWLLRPPPAPAEGYATLDPCKPEPAVLMQAIRQAVRRAKQEERAVSLRLTAQARGGRALALDLTREGDLALVGAPRRAALGLPGVWLPDHPLPLALPAAGSLTLLLEPCEGGRVRAASAAPRRLRARGWAALALLAAAACLLDAGWLLSAALGFAFHAYLLQQQPERAR
jgi:hypothetical protein